jgi:hypothetical protein
MNRVRTWTIEVTISENEDQRRTRAEAVLRTEARPQLRGEGEAHRRPGDTEVPEIGDELATARALADLAYHLLDAAADDIEQVTHRPVHLTS